MNYLEIIGLSFNVIGAIVLALPILKHEKFFDEGKDRLIDLGETEDGQHKYTTERDKEITRKAKIGAILIIIGFILQLISSFL